MISVSQKGSDAQERGRKGLEWNLAAKQVVRLHSDTFSFSTQFLLD